MSRPLHRGGTLGENLRAARLGFAWADDLDAWLRIADAGDLFRIDIVTDRADLPREAIAKRCWWEGDDGGASIAADIAKVMPAVVYDGVACSFLINDDGELVEVL